ncbi:MAG TPA: toll/interleukin-1 receptor domain-containing protein [Ktedonobacteraceae bacterium]|nr:toll/interleukin-1 receptor domain-containing protein [Ktedonobacteraceae bacterium]
MAVEVLLCYAHKDARLLNNLKAHLKSLQHEGLIALWHDRNITAGKDWAREIDEHLNTAQIILLLVSSDFINSDYCYSVEMERALERDKQGEVCAIPIILRPCDWDNSPLSKLQALPKDGKPITTWGNRDSAFLDVAKGLRRVIKEMSIISLYETPPVHPKQEESADVLSHKDIDESALAKLREELQRQREADHLLSEAHHFASDLIHKNELIQKAVVLWPSYKQKEYRQLGLEMSAAVVDGVDYIKWKSMKAAGYTFETPYFEIPLEEDEKAFFASYAVSYLQEVVLGTSDADAQGLLYLACMYGYSQLYDEMLAIIEKIGQFSHIVQDMKKEFRERKMLLLLLKACDSDQMKIERLREQLNIPPTTKEFFSNYIVNEYPLNPNYRYGEYIKWIAIRRSGVHEESGGFIIRITPAYPSNDGKVDAFLLRSNGSPETIVPIDKRVSVDELYIVLSSLFILFGPVD